MIMRVKSSRQIQRRSRPWHSWQRSAALAAAVLALFSDRSAHAACEAAQPSLDFTYPDAQTPSVPPNAVFWAVSRVGTVSVTVDGVALAPRGAGVVDRHQFVPAAPLGDGQHELVASVGTERRSVRFNVAPQLPSSADASVDTVTVYPIELGPTELLNPPRDQYDTECMEFVAQLADICNEDVPPALTRVTYASQGDVIAYLAQGRAIMPARCATYWMPSGERPSPEDHRVAAVLPTGVAQERAFDGPIEVRTQGGTHSEMLGGSDDSSCSIGLGRPAPGTLTSVALAATAWLARRRRARR
jgi:hypothetical protein